MTLVEMSGNTAGIDTTKNITASEKQKYKAITRFPLTLLALIQDFQSELYEADPGGTNPMLAG